MSDEVVSRVLSDLAAFRKSGVAEFVRQRIRIVGKIASGEVVDPRTLDNVLKASECSLERFQREVEHASALAAKRRAAVEAEEIAEKSKPLYDELAKAEAEFAKLQKAYLDMKEDLEIQLYWLREPLKQHVLINGRVRDTTPDIPESLRNLPWHAELRSFGDGYAKRLRTPNPEPGPEATPAARETWSVEERRRIDRLQAMDFRIAVLNRAWELVRENLCDPETGIWDEFSDPNRFLAIAEQELAAKTKSAEPTTVATV